MVGDVDGVGGKFFVFEVVLGDLEDVCGVVLLVLEDEYVFDGEVCGGVEVVVVGYE